MIKWIGTAYLVFVLAAAAVAQDMEHHHDHPAPERLGAVSFDTSCNPAVQPAFNRAVALLHSFAYRVSEEAFRDVSVRDARCAMAHWGMAMTYYHQLWEPPSSDELRNGAEQIRIAAETPETSLRERQYIDALEQY